MVLQHHLPKNSHRYHQQTKSKSLQSIRKPLQEEYGTLSKMRVWKSRRRHRTCNPRLPSIQPLTKRFKNKNRNIETNINMEEILKNANGIKN